MVGPSFVFAMLILSAPAEASATSAQPRREAAAKSAKPLPRPAEIGSKWGVVTSLLRSPARNRAVGGAPNSFHLHGRAIDIARRPGVAHAEIEAAYRKAGYRLVESLDEGDHSHFAFGGFGAAQDETQLAEVAAAPTDPCAGDPSPQGRRRPDRWDGCAGAEEPKPKYRPIERPAL